jgi:hypothetical protein
MRASTTLLLFASLLPAGPGCAARRAARQGSGLARDLDAADALFELRGQPGGASAAIRALLDIDGLHPDNPRVLWRLSRAYTLEGYRAGPPTGKGDLLTGREYALHCLSLQAEFAGVVEGAGGVVTPDAVERLVEDDLGCLLWATLSWGRWLHWQGPAGAAIDLEVVEAMGAHTQRLSGDDFARGRAAAGLAYSARPRLLGGSPDRARAAFEAAVALEPGRLTPRVDLALLVLRPAGEDQAASELLRAAAEAAVAEGDPDAPEDLRARARARSAIGLPPLEPAPVDELPPSEPASPSD